MKVQEVLRKVEEEIEYFRSKCIAHAFEKTRFMEESKRLSNKVEVT